MAASATIGMNAPSVSSITPSIGLAKWKLPLVLVLAFGGVVYFQYGHLFVSEAAADSSSKTAETSVAVDGKPGEATAIVSRDKVELPEIQLSEALQFDPFAPTLLLGDESPVEIVTAPPSVDPITNSVSIEVDSALLQKFKSTPIQLIYADSRGRKVAMIGGKPVHVGDTFQGLRVLDITPGGLIVETLGSDK